MRPYTWFWHAHYVQPNFQWAIVVQWRIPCYATNKTSRGSTRQSSQSPPVLLSTLFREAPLHRLPAGIAFGHPKSDSHRSWRWSVASFQQNSTITVLPSWKVSWKGHIYNVYIYFSSKLRCIIIFLTQIQVFGGYHGTTGCSTHPYNISCCWLYIPSYIPRIYPLWLIQDPHCTYCCQLYCTSFWWHMFPIYLYHIPLIQIPIKFPYCTLAFCLTNPIIPRQYDHNQRLVNVACWYIHHLQKISKVSVLEMISPFYLDDANKFWTCYPPLISHS